MACPLAQHAAWHANAATLLSTGWDYKTDVGSGQEGTAMADRPASDLGVLPRVPTANAIQIWNTAVSRLWPSVPPERGFRS